MGHGPMRLWSNGPSSNGIFGIGSKGGHQTNASPLPAGDSGSKHVVSLLFDLGKRCEPTSWQNVVTVDGTNPAPLAKK